MENEPLKRQIELMEKRLLLRIERTERKLLTEFRKWSIPASGRVRTYEATLAEYRDRL